MCSPTQLSTSAVNIWIYCLLVVFTGSLLSEQKVTTASTVLKTSWAGEKVWEVQAALGSTCYHVLLCHYLLIGIESLQLWHACCTNAVLKRTLVQLPGRLQWVSLSVRVWHSGTHFIIYYLYNDKALSILTTFSCSSTTDLCTQATPSQTHMLSRSGKYCVSRHLK